MRALKLIARAVAHVVTCAGLVLVIVGVALIAAALDVDKKTKESA